MSKSQREAWELGWQSAARYVAARDLGVPVNPFPDTHDPAPVDLGELRDLLFDGAMNATDRDVVRKALTDLRHGDALAKQIRALLAEAKHRWGIDATAGDLLEKMAHLKPNLEPLREALRAQDVKSDEDVMRLAVAHLNAVDVETPEMVELRSALELHSGVDEAAVLREALASVRLCDEIGEASEALHELVWTKEKRVHGTVAAIRRACEIIRELRIKLESEERLDWEALNEQANRARVLTKQATIDNAARILKDRKENPIMVPFVRELTDEEMRLECRAEQRINGTHKKRIGQTRIKAIVRRCIALATKLPENAVVRRGGYESDGETSTGVYDDDQPKIPRGAGVMIDIRIPDPPTTKRVTLGGREVEVTAQELRDALGEVEPDEPETETSKKKRRKLEVDAWRHRLDQWKAKSPRREWETRAVNHRGNNVNHVLLRDGAWATATGAYGATFAEAAEAALTKWRERESEIDAAKAAFAGGTT